MAVLYRLHVKSGQFFILRELLPGGRHCAGSKTGGQSTANALRGRRIGGGQRADRREMRRLSDARRSAGARRRENRGSRRTPGATQFAAAQVWRCWICHCSRNGTPSAGRVAASDGCSTIRRGLRELPAVASRNAI